MGFLDLRGGLDPPFAGALRQRLALRAATVCAAMARLREDGLRAPQAGAPFAYVTGDDGQVLEGNLEFEGAEQEDTVDDI